MIHIELRSLDDNDFECIDNGGNQL